MQNLITHLTCVNTSRCITINIIIQTFQNTQKMGFVSRLLVCDRPPWCLRIYMYICICTYIYIYIYTQYNICS